MSQHQAAHAREGARFRATAGTAQGFGATPQDALAALRLPDEPGLPIVIWPYNRGDAFWTDAHQQRLQELKTRRDDLSAAESAELETLVASAFDATIVRTQSLPLVKS